jgi:hypothetical protein
MVVFLGFDIGCHSGGLARVVTNDRGYYHFGPIPKPALPWSICANVVSPTPAGPYFNYFTVARIATKERAILFKAVVTATPSRTTAPAGERIRIEGKAFPAFRTVNNRVLLQRWTATGWRTEGQDIVRFSGRYTVYASPPRQGTFRYRVIMPSHRPWLEYGSSRAMYLTRT